MQLWFNNCLTADRGYSSMNLPTRATTSQETAGRGMEKRNKLMDLDKTDWDSFGWDGDSLVMICRLSHN